MDANRKLWSEKHKALREVLFKAKDYPKAMALFLEAHAMLHAAAMSNSGLWSYEDEVLDGITDDQMRCIPKGASNSVIWLLWHMARNEDVTMNLLLADSAQVFQADDWQNRLNAGVLNNGSGMGADAVTRVSQSLDIAAVRDYRVAVGRRTREIVPQFPADSWHKKVAPERMQRVMDAGALDPEAREVAAYWGSRTYADLLMMPGTRHNMLHLNEANTIKRKCR